MARGRQYSTELKARSVRTVLESGRPIAQVAKDLDVGSESLRMWVRQAQADAGTRRDLATSGDLEELRRLRSENRELRKANENLEGRERVFRGRARQDPAEVSAFIDQQRAAGFAVELICRSIGTAPSAYYQRATGELSTRAVDDARLLGEILRVFKANYECYGPRRVWEQLRRDDVQVGRGRVERLMAANGLVGAKRRGRSWKTTIADPDGCERPDLVNRDFTATRPDELWIADFTYLRSWDGVGYFSFVIDVYSRRIVG